MRTALLFLMLAGCAATSPPGCPPLPALQADEDPIAYATTLAAMYERCAGARR